MVVRARQRRRRNIYEDLRLCEILSPCRKGFWPSFGEEEEEEETCDEELKTPLRVRQRNRAFTYCTHDTFTNDPTVPKSKRRPLPAQLSTRVACPALDKRAHARLARDATEYHNLLRQVTSKPFKRKNNDLCVQKWWAEGVFQGTVKGGIRQHPVHEKNLKKTENPTTKSYKTSQKRATYSEPLIPLPPRDNPADFILPSVRLSTLGSKEFRMLEAQFLMKTDGRHYIMIDQFKKGDLILGGRAVTLSMIESSLQFHTFAGYVTVFDVLCVLLPMVQPHLIQEVFAACSVFHSTTAVGKRFPPHIVEEIEAIFKKLDVFNRGYLTPDVLVPCVTDITALEIASFITDSQRAVPLARAPSRSSLTILPFPSFAELIKHAYRPCFNPSTLRHVRKE